MKLLSPRRIRTAAAVLLTLLLGYMLMMRPPDAVRLPGGQDRRLVRIWAVSSIGGGQAWLKEQLRAWEKTHPGLSTYLRIVSPAEAEAENAVLPDLILYMPGDFTAPETLFLPLSGSDSLREEMLRCGRWQGKQYGLPLCWGAWVLAIDGRWTPEAAATPAPTALLGRAGASSPPQTTEEPGFPLEAVRAADQPIQAPQGAGLFALSAILAEKPPLPADFALLSPAEVYSGFRSGQYASALLTTGQLTAFDALTAAGKGFACRVMTADEIVTDQVWLGSVVQGASEEAVHLLACLTGEAAQRALASQGLYSVRDDLRLYASSWPAWVEIAAGRGLSAVNAYIPREDAASAAWRVFEGREGLPEALLPLL